MSERPPSAPGPNYDLYYDLAVEGIDGLFSVPIETTELEIDRYHLELIREENGLKKLIVHLPSMFEVKSMVPGNLIQTDLRTVRLETDYFNTISSIGSVSWFRQWLTSPAGTIPGAIIYENIDFDPGERTYVTAGERIGNAAPMPDGAEIHISIEYAGSTPENPRYMNPVEFLSLLFWREDCDPLFSVSPATYGDPLLDKLMISNEDGSECGAENDRWLGLRPPLRTSKRTEWEARQTHVYHNANWQSSGNLLDIIRNPLARGLRGTGQSKCNIIVGELLFRSGFRTFSEVNSPHFGYYTDGALVLTQSEGFLVRQAERSRRVEIGGKEYIRSLPFGRKLTFPSTDEDIARLNMEIIVNGKGIYYARRQFCRRNSGASTSLPERIPHSSSRYVDCNGNSIDASTDPHLRDTADYRYNIFHIFIMMLLIDVLPNANGVHAKGLDQHCNPSDLTNFLTDINGPSITGSRNEDDRVLVELVPGGDPDQPWGIADLNCLGEP